MAGNTLKQVSWIYFTICLLTTIGLLIYSISRYLANEDTTLVKVTQFLSTKVAIYPSLSFCILPPFLEEKFDVYGNPEINMTSYRNFLDGTFWDNRLLRIDYDNVTVSFSDNLISAGFRTHSGTLSNWNAWDADNYVSFRSSKRKCFTINAPFPSMGPLMRFRLRIKRKFFPGEKTPTGKKIYSYLHYPGQRFTAYYTIKTDFTSMHSKDYNYKIEFDVRNIDVITRRNKFLEPCVEDWRNYDDRFMQNKVNEVGCRPPHWKTISDLPLCSDAIQMKSFSRQPRTAEIESFGPPCSVIYRLDYTYHEYNLTKQG